MDKSVVRQSSSSRPNVRKESKTEPENKKQNKSFGFYWSGDIASPVPECLVVGRN